MDGMTIEELKAWAQEHYDMLELNGSMMDGKAATRAAIAVLNLLAERATTLTTIVAWPTITAEVLAQFEQRAADASEAWHIIPLTADQKVLRRALLEYQATTHEAAAAQQLYKAQQARAELAEKDV